jgi:hypothetical protein
MSKQTPAPSNSTTFVLKKGSVKGQFTVARFSKNNPFKSAQNPVTLRQKTLEDEDGTRLLTSINNL